MYASQSNDNWVKQILFCGAFVGLLAVILWGGSLLLDKYNNDQLKRISANNLQLVRDNRELREQNKKLIQQLTDKTRRLDQIKTAMEGYRPND